MRRRRMLRRPRARGRRRHAAAPSISATCRRERGSAGIGIDATEVATLARRAQRAWSRRTAARSTSSPTGVAIFDADQRLTFYNAAYRALWDLDADFLDQSPTDSAVLDQLRAARKLPEEQDFRQWKNQLHEAYRATEPRETVWHLPDRRTLRVVTTPNPEGGVTYLFDDVTERLDLERRFDALIRVQGETLDNLTEAVAVFGSDGRLRLHNPAFAQMWQLAPEVLARAAAYRDRDRACASRCTTTTRSGTRCARPSPRSTTASQLTARLERRDGSVIDCSTVPLPDGATLVDLPGRHRHRQCRARAARAQRGAGDRRRDQDRFRPPRLLRAALAADQHHRLRAFPRRSGDRPAHRQAARISRLSSPPRPTRCSRSSTTSSISPPSMPAP